MITFWVFRKGLIQWAPYLSLIVSANGFTMIPVRLIRRGFCHDLALTPLIRLSLLRKVRVVSGTRTERDEEILKNLKRAFRLSAAMGIEWFMASHEGLRPYQFAQIKTALKSKRRLDISRKLSPADVHRSDSVRIILFTEEPEFILERQDSSHMKEQGDSFCQNLFWRNHSERKSTLGRPRKSYYRL
ncbi:hypothetical protein Tco_0405822 [Tanacetum coccineum]